MDRIGRRPRAERSEVRVPPYPSIWVAGPSGTVLVDVIAVDRALRDGPGTVRLTPDERRYAAGLALAQGQPFAAGRVSRWAPHYSRPGGGRVTPQDAAA